MKRVTPDSAREQWHDRGVAADETRDGVGLTHLDQLLHDDTDITKRELVDYLDAVADRLLAVLGDRALSVIRVLPGQSPFMQKNLPKYAPDWIRTVSAWAERSKRTVTYPVCDDRRTLLWFANQRAVEYHPALYQVEHHDRPSHLVLDIDPPPDGDFLLVVRTLEIVHAALDEAGLGGAVKTSGAKGAHVFVPVADADVEPVAAATRALAARAARLDPELATVAFVVEERHGKVFVDSTRAGGATVAAAYSPRLRPGLPVSFPLAWEDVAGFVPGSATVRTALDLLGGRDPWAELMPAPQTLPEALVEEGRAIPIARVQAMHAGKRRAAARRSEAPDSE